MTIFLLGILRIGLLAAVGLLLAGLAGLAFIKREHQPRLRKYLNIGLIIATVFSAFLYINLNFGRELASEQAPTTDKYVHYHEQFHFYFGSKYIKNVGYDNLYKATYIAVQELQLPAQPIVSVRDLHDFGLYRASDLEKERVAIKERFSAAEWTNFKTDLTTFLSVRQLNVQTFLQDHGNTGSPVWAVPAHLITRYVSPAGGVLVVLALFDLLLLAVMSLMIGRTFGLVSGVVGFVFLTMAPYVSDYLLGSFLRFDWLFATVLGFVFAQQKRWTASGVAFAYAVLSKLFPVFFVIALGIKACWAIYQKAKPFDGAIDMQHYRKFFTGFVVGLVGFFALTVVYFGGTTLWTGYAERTQATLSEKFYLTNYSFRMPFMQLMDRGIGGVIEDRFIPAEVSMGKPNVLLADFAGAWWTVLLLIGAAYAWLIRRRSDVQALALGLPLIFFFLVVNPYYYGMIAVFALYWLPDITKRRAALFGVLGLLATYVLFYYFEHYGYYYYGGYFMSWIYTGFFVALPIAELIRIWNERRGKGAGKIVVAPINQDAALP